MDQRGSLTVEAAFVIPVILVVLMAVIEITSLVATQLELVTAAREAARVAATVPDPSQAATAAREVLGPPLASAVKITVSRPAVVGKPAVVVISFAKPLVTPLLDGIKVPLTARAVMRVEQ